MPENDIVAVILAAGKGTRMPSPGPKVLRTLLGEPMLGYVLDAVSPLCSSILIVAGHMPEKIAAAFSGENIILQSRQLGTGHALLTALPQVEKLHAGRILVVNGDAPLLSEDILAAFIEKSRRAELSFATLNLADPAAYGRVVRHNGQATAIVEAKDYDIAIHGPVSGEVNAGLYLVKTDLAARLLPLLQNNNKSGEYYLTDLIALAASQDVQALAVECGGETGLMGVNTPRELALAEEILRKGIVDKFLNNGVIIHGPDGLRAGPYVKIEPGVEIFTPCEIYGHSRIAFGAVIESHCVIRNSEIGEGARLKSFCWLEQATLAKSAQAGPFARLRPGARLEEGAGVGNFVEIKNAIIGPGTKAGHLSYLGDARIGAKVNIGAGTITCNYDGVKKHETVIGDGAFIGSNTALVAPVAVGANALVGAGSTITKEVPPDDLAVARARQVNLPRRKSGK